MKKKNIVFSLLSFIAIPLIMVGFLTNFWKLDVGSTNFTSGTYKIFDDIPKLFIDSFKLTSSGYQGIWRVLLLVSAALAAVLIGACLVLTILDIAKVGKNIKTLRRVNSAILVVLGVLILGFGLLFSNINVLTLFGDSNPVKLVPQLGFYTMVSAPVVAGVFGLLSTCKNKATKK